MKKVILAIVILLAAAMPVYAHETAADTEQVRVLLSELEIMSGDPDGSFRPDDPVTRGEFTKAAVAASDFKDSVALSLSVSPFRDVPYTHWAAPYIRTGIVNGLVSGYPDASFRPEENVAYEEAVTIMLRVLGYEDSDFGAAWPYGQIGMAERLDMTDGLTSAQAGMPLTRRDVASLIYNTLRCSKKGGQTVQASAFDVSFIEDVTVISTSAQDGSVPGDEIFTDSGSYKIREDFDKSCAGMKGDIALKNGRTALVFFPSPLSASGEERYVVYSVLSGSVIAWKDGDFEALDISPSARVYNGTVASTYSALTQDMEPGDIISVRRTGGAIDYVRYERGDMKGPYTAQDSSSLALCGADSSASVIRCGRASTAAEIQPFDVFYYLPELDTVFVYNTKVTGVYEKALPNKDNPTEVQVSGTVYKIESAQAFRALSSSGGIDYGETVTLLMGRNNEAADVMGVLSQGDGEVAGYVVDAGTKPYSSGELKDYSGYYIRLVEADGTEHEYICDRDYSDSKNSVVVLSISDGRASAQTARTGSAGGSFAWDTRRLGSDSLDSSVEILDVGTTDKNITSMYVKTYPSRLDGVNISSSKVLYSHRNSSGAIDRLILNDVTGDSYTFGLAVKAESRSMGVMASGTYEYIVDGTSHSYISQNTAYTINSGQGIRLSSPTSPVLMSNLARLDGNVTLSSAQTAVANGQSYQVSPEVQVYEKETIFETQYRLKPISELVGSTEYSLTAYYDKPQSSGGRIRIIVAVKR